MPDGALNVMCGGVRERLPIRIGELADDPAWHTRSEDPGRQDGVREHDRAGRHERSGAYLGAAQHGGADPDERALPHLGSVHHGPVPETDPVCQDRRLTSVHVQAAQVLDIAFLANADLSVIGAQH
jgi:hypothetical protein